MFWRRKRRLTEEAPKEPLFTAVRSGDEEMQRAYGLAAGSIYEFRAHLERPGDHICAAKLRFRDPALSERLGEDRFLFLWLAGVEYDSSSDQFLGSFFEVPHELTQWHRVGQTLRFAGEDIFDWFVNDDGHLFGGYTMRVARARLPEAERAAYDAHTGVKTWHNAELN